METRPDPTIRQGFESSRRFDDIPGSTPKEKLQNAHARLRAPASVAPTSVAESATPSSAGDIEPVVPVSVPQTTLPLSTRAHENPENLAASVEEQGDATDVIVVSPALLFPEQASVQTIQPSAIFEKTEHCLPGSLRLGPSEFAVTMPMDSVGKDNYERALAEHSESVKLLLSGFKSGDGTVPSQSEQAQVISDIRHLIEKLDNVAIHTDLNIAEHVKQSKWDSHKEASWAEYTSSKFLFLGHLIEIAGAQDLHILFMVGKKETAELVERYFQGKGFAPVRPRAEMHGHVELSLVNGSLSVGILSTEHDGTVETYRPPAVIIALDSSFNTSSPVVEHLRTTYTRNGNLLPVVHLMIANSSEHIQRCLPDLPEPQRLRLLVHIVKSLVDVLGDLQDDALGVQDDAEEIFTCLMSEDFNVSWNLPPIEPLHILVSNDLQTQEPLGAQAPDPMTTGSSVNKRIFDTLDAVAPDSKRQRLHLSQDLTQTTTQSTAPPSQTLDLTAKLQALEARLVEMKTDHAAEVDRLQETITDYETRSKERIKGWEDLQHRYETRNKELHQLRRERDGLTVDKAKLEQKVVKQQEEITKLKDERTQLKHDLESARKDLKAEGGLSGELETLRQKIRELTDDHTKLTKTLEYEKKQAEYAREQYQNASSRAAELANEKQALQSQQMILQSQVDAEAVKLKELKLQNGEAKHLARVKELEQTLESRESLLRKKEEELRTIRNNRPATRATSTQPRSPKSWGNGSRPTSPGINNNGLGNRGSGLRFSSEMSF
ncbi:conserved hypothetical protein [Talaromyces stipitatus ATCC 10500]|uniref:HDA1 complex subunit n=1 Tax=Talaromyces stipitatus (strain ATCC 10500 / CBS 375.48 / QM 6759 / NRRL 1006) TaxID=441959 RepID=B8MDG0_TALSN|nr:uncharacterized protein TSTA_117090 [Talaromyces stipitatus ATCC 10500]EED17923.1 conserved hypothetical protein [Talaromyces stipitatus ATCC 10500]